MAKELRIDGRMKVKALKEQFKDVFGGTLRVYDGNKFADDDATIASIRKSGNKKVDSFTIGGNMQVKGFVERMLENYGITVKVATADDSKFVKPDVTLARVADVVPRTKKEQIVVEIEDYTITIATNNSVRVCKNGEGLDEAKPALREIADIIGFPYNDEWSTQRLAREIVKAKGIQDNADVEGFEMLVDEDEEMESEPVIAGDNINQAYVGEYSEDGKTLIRVPKEVGPHYDIKPGTEVIGEKAFEGCSKLVSVTIPESVTEIGEKAFYECSKLVSVTIPESVTKIGDYAFYESGLQIVNFNAINCEDADALIMPWSLTSLNFGESVKSIPSSLAHEVTGLTSVVIPDSVTEIGSHAFCMCENLKSVTIGNSVEKIYNNAFNDCGLTSVIIPDSVTYIGAEAFMGCHELTSIDIPDSVTEIGDAAFLGCPLPTYWKRFLCNGFGWDVVNDSWEVSFPEKD